MLFASMLSILWSSKYYFGYFIEQLSRHSFFLRMWLLLVLYLCVFTAFLYFGFTCYTLCLYLEKKERTKKKHYSWSANAPPLKIWIKRDYMKRNNIGSCIWHINDLSIYRIIFYINKQRATVPSSHFKEILISVTFLLLSLAIMKKNINTIFIFLSFRHLSWQNETECTNHFPCWCRSRFLSTQLKTQARRYDQWTLGKCSFKCYIFERFN